MQDETELCFPPELNKPAARRQDVQISTLPFSIVSRLPRQVWDLCLLFPRTVTMSWSGWRQRKGEGEKKKHHTYKAVIFIEEDCQIMMETSPIQRSPYLPGVVWSFLEEKKREVSIRSSVLENVLLKPTTQEKKFPPISVGNYPDERRDGRKGRIRHTQRVEANEAFDALFTPGRFSTFLFWWVDLDWDVTSRKRFLKSVEFVSSYATWSLVYMLSSVPSVVFLFSSVIT